MIRGLPHDAFLGRRRTPIPRRLLRRSIEHDGADTCDKLAYLRSERSIHLHSGISHTNMGSLAHQEQKRSMGRQSGSKASEWLVRRTVNATFRGVRSTMGRATHSEILKYSENSGCHAGRSLIQFELATVSQQQSLRYDRPGKGPKGYPETVDGKAGQDRRA